MRKTRIFVFLLVVAVSMLFSLPAFAAEPDSATAVTQAEAPSSGFELSTQLPADQTVNPVSSPDSVCGLNKARVKERVGVMPLDIYREYVPVRELEGYVPATYKPPIVNFSGLANNHFARAEI